MPVQQPRRERRTAEAVVLSASKPPKTLQAKLRKTHPVPGVVGVAVALHGVPVAVAAGAVGAHGEAHRLPVPRLPRVRPHQHRHMGPSRLRRSDA